MRCTGMDVHHPSGESRPALSPHRHQQRLRQLHSGRRCTHRVSEEGRRLKERCTPGLLAVVYLFSH